MLPSSLHWLTNVRLLGSSYTATAREPLQLQFNCIIIIRLRIVAPSKGILQRVELLQIFLTFACRKKYKLQNIFAKIAPRCLIGMLHMFFNHFIFSAGHVHEYFGEKFTKLFSFYGVLRPIFFHSGLSSDLEIYKGKFFCVHSGSFDWEI